MSNAEWLEQERYLLNVIAGLLDQIEIQQAVMKLLQDRLSELGEKS